MNMRYLVVVNDLAHLYHLDTCNIL